MTTFWAVLKCLPEIFALIRTLKAAADEAETERKVKADVKTIQDAFATNDASKLNALFASK